MATVASIKKAMANHTLKAVYMEPLPKKSRGDKMGKTTIGNTGTPRKNPHRGDDWSAGGLIKSISTGRVTKVFWSDELGNCLIAKNADGLFIIYAHLAAASSRKVGDMLIAGETIVGKAGNTGAYSFGTHLHAACSTKPMPHLAPAAELISLFDLIDASTEQQKLAA